MHGGPADRGRHDLRHGGQAREVRRELDALQIDRPRVGAGVVAVGVDARGEVADGAVVARAGVGPTGRGCASAVASGGMVSSCSVIRSSRARRWRGSTLTRRRVVGSAGDDRDRRCYIRLARTVALEDLLDAGTIVAIGSDWPIGPFDPREIIAIAEMRRRVGAVDMGAVGPSQRLTRAEALTAYTLSAAQTAGVDEGAIAPGRSASFTVFRATFSPRPRRPACRGRTGHDHRGRGRFRRRRRRPERSRRLRSPPRPGPAQSPEHPEGPRIRPGVLDVRAVVLRCAESQPRRTSTSTTRCAPAVTRA